MRHAITTFCRALCLGLMLSLPAAAQEARNPDIEATIQNQFDAFLAEDAARAFTYASPMIQGIFGSSDNFGAMVRQGYPMVWDPANVRMLDLRRENGRLSQRVMVTDQGGRTHILDYRMLETADGWQIDGVELLQQSGVGA